MTVNNYFIAVKSVRKHELAVEMKGLKLMDTWLEQYINIITPMIISTFI